MWIPKKRYTELLDRVEGVEKRTRALERETGLRAEFGFEQPWTTSEALAALRQDFGALVKSLGVQRKVIPAEKARVEYVAPPVPATSGSSKMKRGE